MDYTFPNKLFPVYFNSGPPSSTFNHNVGGWGSYGQVLEVNVALHEKDTRQPKGAWKFESQHHVTGEPWVPVEPVAMPLLRPRRASEWSSTTLSDPLDFSEHMQNFYQYNYKDAFCTMSHILGEKFHFGQGKRKGSERNAVHMWQTAHFMETLKYKKCELTHLGRQAKRYNNLFSDVIHDIPPALLADLLHEELTYQREQEQFSDHNTGGAIGYIPFTNTSTSQRGCLVYPGKAGLNNLKFHRLVLEFQGGKPPCLDVSHKPLSLQLNGTIRQITIGLQQDECHVGVRSDHLCGVWKVSEQNMPEALDVIQTKQPATCLSASPHVQGELLVASESGAAYLWTVGKGLQKYRQEYSNLYFNSKSSWRWCDFSGHPRVMVYADRTGVELTDIRTKDCCSHTLFRIGQTPDCKSGERVILSNYLREVHTFHHLVTTQHSAYIMDERFPCLPMIQWDHMMENPPMFAQVVAGLPSGSGGGTTKVLLGSQKSQEVILLQYSGGREEACVTRGPPQALLSPRNSLGHLPVQLPHRQHHAQDRLGRPATGFTVIHQSHGMEECICVLQLTEAGDIFYHTLRSQTESFRKEDPPAPTQNSVVPEGRNGAAQRLKQPVETLRKLLHQTLETSRSRDIDVTWYSSGPPSPADDSGFEGRGRPWDTPRAGPEVVINDTYEDAYLSLASNTGLTDTQETAATVHPPTAQSLDTNVNTIPVRPRPMAKVSDEALLVWRKWFLKLFKSPQKRPNLPHRTTKTKGLLPDNNLQRDPLEDDCFRSLRKDLRETMRNGNVLVQRNTYLKSLALVPVPAPVEPSEWADALSKRMSASWEPGLGGWRSWWEERLGLNREEKVEALRRKRRRQKQAKAHRRIDLSGTFTSSVSYQSDLDIDSLSGWSSAASQGASSDVDSVATSCYYTKWDALSEPGTTRATTPHKQTSISQPTTPHRELNNGSPLEQLSTFFSQPTVSYTQFSSSSQPTIPHTQFPSSEPLFTPQKQSTVGSLSPWTKVGSDSPSATILRTVVASQKKPQNQDYLSSLFGSQEPAGASQGGGFNESSHSTPLATSSQLSSISTSQRNPKVGLSSQTSSQPKRKKSRMGF